MWLSRPEKSSVFLLSCVMRMATQSTKIRVYTLSHPKNDRDVTERV